MTYINLPIETDDNANAALAFQVIQDQFPDWTPNDGNLDTWIIRACSRLAADLKDLASDVDDGIFRYFGPMVGITPHDDIPATTTTKWTLVDNAGHTITSGTVVLVVDANLDQHQFQVGQDVVVPAGNTIATGVPITAITTGISENGIGNIGDSLVTDIAWVQSVTLEAPTSGGEDAEDDDDFLARLANTLTTLAPRPIIPSDFAILALNTDGVGRALAIDGYNPADQTSNNERMVAVAVVDGQGNAVSSTIKNNVDATLQAQREVNFIVNVIDPTYTTVDINYNVVLWPGYVQASVQADILTALNNWLNPSTWGTPPGGDTTQWYSRPAIKVNDEIAIIGGIAGVKDVLSVTHRTGANAFGTADINMTGAAALPKLGVVTPTFS